MDPGLVESFQWRHIVANMAAKMMSGADAILKDPRRRDEYLQAMALDNQVTASSLSADTDMLYRTRMDCKRDLWRMISVLRDVKHKRTGYHNDAALKLTKEYIAAVYKGSMEALQDFLDSILTEFYKLLHPLERDIARRNPSVLGVISAHSQMKKLGLGDKLPTMKEQVKAVVWDWIDHWLRVSNKYHIMSSIPAGVFTAIRSVAEDMIVKTRQGLDPGVDMVGLTTMVMSRSGRDAKDAFQGDQFGMELVLKVVELIVQEVGDGKSFMELTSKLVGTK